MPLSFVGSCKIDTQLRRLCEASNALVLPIADRNAVQTFFPPSAALTSTPRIGSFHNSRSTRSLLLQRFLLSVSFWRWLVCELDNLYLLNLWLGVWVSILH